MIQSDSEADANTHLAENPHLTLPNLNAVSAFLDLNKIVFEQATDAILVSDFKGNLLDVNSSLCRMFGYTKEELLGMNVKKLIDSNHLINHPVRFDRLAAGENIFTERMMVHKDSTIVHVEANSKKINDSLILVIARNIDRIKNADRVLESTLTNLKTIFDNTDTIYVLMDKDLRIVSYNPPAERFANNELGHTIKISNNFLDYFPEEKKAILFAYIQEVIAGKKINYDVKYPQLDGTLNWYHARLFPIKNAEKEVTGLIMAVSDITEKKVLEQRLEQERLKKQIEITDAVITAEENERRQIGLELHDNVNQLLATARMYVSLAKPMANAAGVDTMNEADQFIATAIDEIRKLSHNLVTPCIKKFGLLDSVKLLAETVAKGTRLRINCDMDINENMINQKLSLAIYRIAQEQLNNIVRHAKAEKIDIRLYTIDDKVTLHISDDGVGFDISIKRTGIGLLNIKTRASLFNGEMFVNSKPGMGCELKIVFDRPLEDE